MEESEIEKNYLTWKKNSPLIYDIMISHTLEWPSLSIEFFPEYTISSDEEMKTHRLLMGTHTNKEEPNYIMIANLSIPDLENPKIKVNNSNDPAIYRGRKAHFSIKQKIYVQEESHRIRYMPQNPNILAAKGPSGKVNIFDITSHPLTPNSTEENSQMVLKGDTSEGYALVWDDFNSGKIYSAGESGKIFYWDINQNGKESNPLQIFEGHEKGIEDIDNKNNIMVSVGNDEKIIFWDIRESIPCVIIENAHNGDINTVNFSPFNENELASGGSDGNIKIWDFRNPDNELNNIKAHDDEILNLKYSPHNKNIICSGSKDRTAKIFDLSLAGQTQSKEDELDGAVEMIFVHAGHRSILTDLAWNYNEENMIGSVSDDNILHIWKKVSN